ncbi:hypothetical protein [Actinomadura harenae]|uniref:Uncharacterized protein n=1 Tax=Actinomadura harenae TaxID=2483351 RepID=A0A3M2LP46_9ACTN|nr:hypothetical protein [Actinomadura harenae]RMI38876.1 hypothetical protein EBO15_31365 [Actinomadura harenae]
MTRPTPRSVRRKLARLGDREKAKLAKHGFGPFYALEYMASEGDGARLIDSVLALYTETGRRLRRPDDAANAARAKQRARTFRDELLAGRLPATPRMGLYGVLASWAVIWSIVVVVVPGGMYVMTLTSEWLGVVVPIGGFALILIICGYISMHGHVQAWAAVLPLLLVLVGVVAATWPLHLMYKGEDMRGELVRVWTTDKGGKTEQRHCRVAFDDAGTRREIEVGGCSGHVAKLYRARTGEGVPVRFILSSGGVGSRLGTRDGLSVTWQAYTAGTGLVLLAGLTTWGVTEAVRHRRRPSRPV